MCVSFILDNVCILYLASLVAQRVKHLPARQETWVQSLDWEDPLEKEMETTLLLLPGKSHGQRSLVGYSPWDCKELDMRATSLTHSLTHSSFILIVCYSFVFYLC